MSRSSWALCAELTTALPAYRRVRRLDLISRWWPRQALGRTHFPDPVFLNRLAVPLWVFIFGIGSVLRWWLRHLGRPLCGELATGHERVTDGLPIRPVGGLPLGLAIGGGLTLAGLRLSLGPLVDGGHHDVHAAPFEKRWALDRSVFGQHAGRLVQKIAPQVGVRHLTPAELDRNFHPISVVEELPGPPQLGAQVVGVDLDPETDLLEGLRLLLLLGFALALLDLVLVLAKVEDAADRRHRDCRGLHEGEALVLCQRQRILPRPDAQLPG